MKRQRGAVLVETALVVGIGLTLLLFGVQVGVLGFLQVTADAAAFVDAHQNVLGGATPEDTTHGVFPQIAKADITGAAQPAPIATFPVNYLYNSSNPNDVSGSQQNRHGGVSMLQPLLYTTTVKPHAFFTRGQSKFGVAGADIEPQWVECGAHHDVANANAACGSTAPSNYQVNYFSQGENTPPFYVGFNYIEHCLDAQPWTSCTTANGGVNFIALGTAEFLDVDNWAALTPGASGTGLGLGGKSPLSTFEFAACHQRAYAALAQFFNKYPDLVSIYNDYELSGIIPQLTSGGLTDFRSWTEFTPVQNVASAADLSVRQVYGWDAQVQQGYAPATYKEPGTYPMNPGGGC